jgi:hypothetical protein
MTYGARIHKNGKTTGYLLFKSGKRVFLTQEERAEFQEKLRFWNLVAIEQHDQLCKVPA